MPIYEFYCPDCHRILSFLSRTVKPSGRPACPHCGTRRLRRQASSFAVSKGRPEEAPDTPDGVDEDRLERAMASLAEEAGRIDEEDPRAMASLMRRMYDATGLEVGPGMDEAIRRMEAGEDPDQIEEELGDLLEDEDPFAPPGEAARLRGMTKRLKPPTVDSTLYEM
jgi:putative FmdB family regulatory protein